MRSSLGLDWIGAVRAVSVKGGRDTVDEKKAEVIHVFYFISTPFFPAQPGVAYRKAVFEPQVCLDVCLTNQRTLLYEIAKKVELRKIKLGNVSDVYFFFSV